MSWYDILNQDPVQVGKFWKQWKEKAKEENK